MTKCKHDGSECGTGGYCDKCHHEDMSMPDSIQQIIETLRQMAIDLNSCQPDSVADRLEELQKQPVAWTDENGLLGYAKWGQYTIPLIRAD